MPLFKKLDQQKKMEIIREGEKKINIALEQMIEKKRANLLGQGHDEEQVNQYLDDLRDRAYREAIIFFNNEMRGKTNVQTKLETYSLKH